MMKNKDLVLAILDRYSCATARQISVLANVRYNQTISASQVSGVLRPMMDRGEIGSSKNAKNENVYWVIE